MMTACSSLLLLLFLQPASSWVAAPLRTCTIQKQQLSSNCLIRSSSALCTSSSSRHQLFLAKADGKDKKLDLNKIDLNEIDLDEIDLDEIDLDQIDLDRIDLDQIDDAMLEEFDDSFINENIDDQIMIDNSDVVGPPESDDLAPMVRAIVEAADMRKAEDIVAMRVSKFTTLTTFLVFCTGNSRPQNQAISVAIQETMKDDYGRLTKGDGLPEGTPDSGWILLDYGNVMVHIMTPKSRLFYDVEGQWREKGGEMMDLSDILMPNAAEAQMGGGMAVPEEEDPFWS